MSKANRVPDSPDERAAKESEIQHFVDYVYKINNLKQVSTGTSTIPQSETEVDGDLLMKVWPCIWCGTKTTAFHVLDESGSNPAKPCTNNLFTRKHESTKYNIVELLPLASLVDCGPVLESKFIARYDTLADLFDRPIVAGIGYNEDEKVVCLIASAYCETLYRYGWRTDLTWVIKSRKISYVPSTVSQILSNLNHRSRRGDTDKSYFAPALHSRCEQRPPISFPFIPFAVIRRSDDFKRFV